MANKVFSFDQTDSSGESMPGSRGNEGNSGVTYVTFDSAAPAFDETHPLMVLSDRTGRLSGGVDGHFAGLSARSTFDFPVGRTVEAEDILSVDSRFADLLLWMREHRIAVHLSGTRTGEGFAVTGIREVDEDTGAKLSAADGFLSYAVSRLLETAPPTEADALPEEESDSDEMKLTSLQSMSDYLDCAKNTLPANIRRWCRRNLAVARSEEVRAEGRRHAQHALSVMLNVRWKDSRFGGIDPVKARSILDEELYGMDKVKQRIIETVIQVNRTHKLPAYGLLLVGPAGTGKSQIAYAVARILGLPWTSLDMSSIHDAEQLTGSSRVYSNARPGSIMDAFSLAGQSNLVFIINELDKADSRTAAGNPADALLTLLDNLGFTDNYMECTIPTDGVYPIATANDRSRISDPLLTRFAVIDIPDYTPEEKKIIFTDYALPKVLRRIGLRPEECRVTGEAAEEVVRRFEGIPGVRDLEQAAERLAANAMFRIETEGISDVTFTPEAVRELL